MPTPDDTIAKEYLGRLNAAAERIVTDLAGEHDLTPDEIRAAVDRATEAALPAKLRGIEHWLRSTPDTPPQADSTTYRCGNCPHTVVWRPDLGGWRHLDGIIHCDDSLTMDAFPKGIVFCTARRPFDERLECSGPADGHATHATYDRRFDKPTRWMTEERADADVSAGEIAAYRILNDVHRTGYAPHATTLGPTAQWLTNTDIEAALAGRRPPVSGRTVRDATKRLHEMGLLDRQFVHPSFLYRIKAGPLDGDAAKYRDRLREAAGALGQPLDTERTTP